MEKKLNKLIEDNNFTLTLETPGETTHLYVKNEGGLYICGWYRGDFYASSEPNIESITVTDEYGALTDESIALAYERVLGYINVMEKYRRIFD